VLANRPLDLIAGAENRRKLQLSLTDTPLPELINNDIGEVTNDPFRGALVRLMAERGLYSRRSQRHHLPDADAVSRVNQAAGAECRSATYTVDVKLFADGNMIRHTACCSRS
jgi:hypothetical protein